MQTDVMHTNKLVFVQFQIGEICIVVVEYTIIILQICDVGVE